MEIIALLFVVFWIGYILGYLRCNYNWEQKLEATRRINKSHMHEYCINSGCQMNNYYEGDK